MGGDSNAYGVGEAARMLAWWVEAGVDVAIQEQPRNWLKPKPVEPRAIAATGLAATPAPLEMPDSLPPFREWLATTPTLPFASPSARRALPTGKADARIMLISDAPDFDAAVAGQPMAGAIWTLTQRMLAAIRIPLDEAYVASFSCFHSPGIRTSDDELKACAAIARRHVALVRPKRLLLLGEAPARGLLGKPLTAARGRAHMVENVRTVATFHPRQLLERPSDKVHAWRDLLLLMEDER